MEIKFGFTNLVLQPTSLCNLDCTYCYLPNRDKNLRMGVEVTQAIAKNIASFPKMRITWHGGEPLACGLDHFEKLIKPFISLEEEGKVKHSIQTNATLINDDWCQFFLKHQFVVGVSIDGPQYLNRNRIDWNGKESYLRVIKGIECLKRNGLDFPIIAVVSDESLDKAKEMYRFFCDIGCKSLGINVEEKECVNIHRDICDDTKVKMFWAELFNEWKINPVIDIREITKALVWMNIISKQGVPITSYYRDIFPTVGYNGDVVLLSPELLGGKHPVYHNFVVGNILKESLEDIIIKGKETWYVTDFIEGVKKCEEECSYFSLCQGGYASNKYYENGSMNTTETVSCRNMEQRLLEGFMGVL